MDNDKVYFYCKGNLGFDHSVGRLARTPPGCNEPLVKDDCLEPVKLFVKLSVKSPYTQEYVYSARNQVDPNDSNEMTRLFARIHHPVTRIILDFLEPEERLAACEASSALKAALEMKIISTDVVLDDIAACVKLVNE